jgi:HEAT repeat protein
MPLFGPPNVDSLLARGKIEALIKAAKYKRDPAVAEAARASLETQIDLLFRMLDHRNLRVVAAAREGLRLVGSPAVERLIFILENGHVHRREDAAFALGDIRDPAAVPALVAALGNSDPLLRMIAATALGKIGDARAHEPLTARLVDENPQVVRAARKSLGQLAG